jgi:hypothetical protein
MRKLTKDRHRDNLAAGTVLLTRSRSRDLLHNPLVRATRIEIVQSELFEDVLHVTCCQNHGVIQTFAPNVAKKALVAPVSA